MQRCEILGAGQRTSCLAALRRESLKGKAKMRVFIGDESIVLERHSVRSLADAVFGGMPGPLCGGLRHCGNCRVRFLSSAPEPCPEDRLFFSEEDLRSGWRLACRVFPDHPVFDSDIALEAPRGRNRGDGRNPFPGWGGTGSGKGRGRHRGILCVDIGTTTIEWAVPETGHAGAFLNPQSGWGSDVMSRLAFAMRSEEARGALCRAVRQEICRIVRTLRTDSVDVMGIAAAGNPAMTAFFLDADISGLCAAPYRLDDHGGRVVLVDLNGKEARSAEHPAASFPGDAAAGVPSLEAMPVAVPPQYAPFVGSDVSAGLALLAEERGTFVFCDMGTNGEFVYFDGERYHCASVPLGPALEGAGMSCGGPALPGAIRDFALSPAGLEFVRVGDGSLLASPELPGNGTICGSGYVALADCLVRCGVLRKNGSFDRAPSSPLGKRIARGLESVGGETVFLVQDRTYFSASDVEALLYVKAAFAAAVQCLAGGNAGNLFVGGSLGMHVRARCLENLGFVAPGTSGRTHFLGNACLKGLERLCGAPELWARLAALSPAPADMASSEHFKNVFTDEMHF